MIRNSIIRLLTVGSLATVLAACSLVPKGPELTVYQLPQREVQKQNTVPASDVLRVALPYSRNYLDTHRVIVVTPEKSLAVMEGIRWEDLGPVVFRDSLIRALRSAGIYRVVINEDTAAGDYSLRSDLHDFQLDYSVEPAQVVISLDASLSNLKVKDYPINTASFTARSTISDNSKGAILNAFADANQQVQSEIIQWLSMQPLAQ